MGQTTWIINVLDDSNRRSIEYENRFWLRQNVEKMNIRVRLEDCTADFFRIAEVWGKEGTIIVQDGKKIKSKVDFHPGKEALLIVKLKENKYVFLYSPKE